MRYPMLLMLALAMLATACASLPPKSTTATAAAAQTFVVGDHVKWRNGSLVMEGTVTAVHLNKAMVSYTDQRGKLMERPFLFERLSK